MQRSYASMHRLDWNDLRYLLAVAEHGSLSGAARALTVNHSTVLRRIGRFEDQLAVRLFERLPSGYALTAAGEALANSARQISEAVTSVERRIVGQDLRLSGQVRVATTDTLALFVLPAMVARFRAAHPEVQIELAAGNLQADLTRRDADVAVRPTQRPPDHLLGRKVCRVAYAPYAAQSYLAQQPRAPRCPSTPGSRPMRAWPAAWSERTCSATCKAPPSASGPTRSRCSPKPPKRGSASRCYPAISASQSA